MESLYGVILAIEVMWLIGDVLAAIVTRGGGPNRCRRPELLQG